MKKTLIALAALSAIAGAAQAQSSVTLYGRLDAGLGQSKTETIGANAKASLSQNLVTTSALNTTFWGLKGSEDLGGGMKANFKLESKFAVDTGAAANTLFEREATVGLAGAFGSVNLGRTYTANYTLYSATNNIYDTNVATTSTVWANGVAMAQNNANNMIRYDSPVFGGVSGAVAIGLGEDKQTATNVGDATGNISMHIKYAAGPLLVGYSHQEEKLASLTTTQIKNKYDLVAGSYDFGVAKLTGGYNQAKNGTLKDKEYQVGVSMPFGAAAVAAGYTHSKSTGAALETEGKGFTLAATYDLSKRTTLYAGYLITEVESNTAAKAPIVAGFDTVKASTFAAGVRHTF